MVARMNKLSLAEDLVPIAEFKTHASRLLRRMGRTLRPLVSGRMIPEYGDPTIREAFVGSYCIICRLEAERILVPKFLEGHRRPIRR